jgi:hypothetical protein
VARRPCIFRQHDVTRAIKAAFAAGATRACVEVAGMVIRAEKTSGESSAGLDAPNEWDSIDTMKGPAK